MYIPSLRGVLGDWVYYSALLKAKDISKRIKPSHDIREAKALEDFLQRALKPRVRKISQYLIRRDSRFFNSIIVGIFDGLPQWAEFNLGTVAGKLTIENPHEIKESLGLLIFNGDEKMFAIDGQHRLEGIKLAYKDEPKRIGEDQYPVIFVAHMDTAAGKIRTRRLFCDINKNAVAVSEGDKVIIDEDDLSAIVTRRLYAKYPAFRRGWEIAVTERKEILEQNSEERFTSLLAVYTVCKRLKKLHKRPRGTLENGSESVEAFQKTVAVFFDFIIRYEPSLRGYFEKGSTTLAAERKNNTNLFFRPVGLEVLARLYAHFAARDKLVTLQHALQTFHFKNPRGIFDGILWNRGKIEASAKAKKAGVDLCLYLLHELGPAQRARLIETLREVKKDPDYSLPPLRFARLK